MSDQAPKPATDDDVLKAVQAASGKHTAALWIGAVILVAMLTGAGVYFADRAEASAQLDQARETTAQALKESQMNELRLQALSDSLADESPELKLTLDTRLKALGFQPVADGGKTP